MAEPCAHCGAWDREPLDFYHHCTPCRLKEDPTDDYTALLWPCPGACRELGLPPDYEHHLALAGAVGNHLGPEWRDYTVEWIGPPGFSSPPPVPPLDVVTTDDDGTELVCLQPWLMRVYYARAPAFVEWRWAPPRGWRISVVCPRTVSQQQLWAAWRGAVCLGLDTARGPKPGRGLRLNDPSAVQAKYWELADRWQHLPSQLEVAQEMYVAERTVRNLLDRKCLAWPPPRPPTPWLPSVSDA